MNVENLRKNHPKLITFMEEEGYHANYVFKVRQEIRRILRLADKKGWRSYSDVYQDYASRLRSYHYLSKVLFKNTKKPTFAGFSLFSRTVPTRSGFVLIILYM
jgi:preprotein translocase subunit Sss1